MSTKVSNILSTKPITSSQSVLKTSNQGKISGIPKVSNPISSGIKPMMMPSSVKTTNPLQSNVKNTNPIQTKVTLSGTSSKSLNLSTNKTIPSSSKSTNLPGGNKPMVSSKSSMKSDRKDESKLRYSKEANKTYYAEPPKDYGGIFKDRPGISITPINQSALQKPPMPTSLGKTLQQKLAERQKQNPGLQQQKKNPVKHDTTEYQINFSQKSFTKPVPAPAHSASYIKPTQPIPNFAKPIPSSLTITKTPPSTGIMQGLHTGDSGISISPLSSPSFSKSDVNPMMNFRKPSVPKLKVGRKIGSEITVTPNYSKPTYIDEPKINFPPNIPMSLSVLKKDNKPEPKPATDAIEIITIE